MDRSGVSDDRNSPVTPTGSTAATSTTTPRRKSLGMRRSSSTFSPFSTPVKDSRDRLRLVVGEDLNEGLSSVLLTPKWKIPKLEEGGRGNEMVASRIFTVDIRGLSSSDLGFLLDSGNGTIFLYSEDACEMLHEENVLMDQEAIFDKVPFVFGPYQLTIRKETNVHKLVVGRSVTRKLFQSRAGDAVPESSATHSGETRSTPNTSSTESSCADVQGAASTTEYGSLEDSNLFSTQSDSSVITDENRTTTMNTSIDKDSSSTSKVDNTWDSKISFKSFTPTRKEDGEMQYFRVNFNTKVTKEKHKTFEHDGQLKVNFSDHAFVCIPDTTESRLGILRGKYNFARSNFRKDNTVILIGMEFYIVEEMTQEEYNRNNGIE
jgi:hypothetical protein